MARVRSPARDEAFEIYKKYNGNIDLVEIAKILSLSPGTIRGWKAKDKWDSELNGTLQKNTERSNKKVNKKGSKKESIADEVKEVLENTELTDKQRLFCIYYIEHFNATKAYKKAYGCSYDTARANGSKTLANTNIKKEIARLTKECLDEKEINSKLIAKRIFQKYIDIAFADIGDYLTFGKERNNYWSKDSDGNDIPIIDPETGEQKYSEYNYVLLNNSDDLDTALLSEVSEGKDGVKIKLQDKMKALDWLDKHYGQLEILTAEKLELEKTKVKQAQERIDYEKNKDNQSDKPIEILIKRKERD